MNVLDKLEYGLFVLSAHENQKDNACITNVAMQVTDNPIRIAFTVNKNNLTHDMIFNTGKFTLSILTTDVPMELIQHFGFKSGREVEKFENYPYAQKNQQGDQSGSGGSGKQEMSADYKAGWNQAMEDYKNGKLKL